MDILRGLGASGHVGMKGLDSVSSLHLPEGTLQALTKGRSLSPGFLKGLTIANTPPSSEKGRGSSKHGGMSRQLVGGVSVTFNLEN